MLVSINNLSASNAFAISLEREQIMHATVPKAKSYTHSIDMLFVGW